MIYNTERLHHLQLEIFVNLGEIHTKKVAFSLPLAIPLLIATLIFQYIQAGLSKMGMIQSDETGCLY